MTQFIEADAVGQAIDSDETRNAAAAGGSQPQSANVNGTSGNDNLTGTTGDDVINGGTGADTMTGLTGNDVYYVDNAGDIVVEVSGGGNDTVRSTISYTLAAQVERLILSGTASINGTGNALANTINGNAGNNILDGGAGADTMIGGAGDDTYYVDNVGDLAVEAANQGTDTVYTTVSLSIAGQYIENLVLAGSAGISGRGNSLDNVITGNSGANTLNGDTGADRMVGGLGNDVYYVDNAGDVVIELDGQGTDSVRTTVSYSIAGQYIENMTLLGVGVINATGNSLDNAIQGNNAVNIIDGGAGADSMRGAGGDDTYYVDNVGDTIVEADGQGYDSVFSSVSFSLAGQYIEALTLTGTANINATGNGQANKLTGNSGNNILNGGAGADTMTGGAGDDIFYVDNVGDVAIEQADGGNDTVLSSVSFSLLAHGLYVETLTLTGSAAIDATGTNTSDILNGNSGANTLDGGRGADTMAGGAGNDIYIVDNPGDVVTEGVNAGTDTVQASITYTLGANVEKLVLTGTAALNGTGNSAANTLTGNSGANILDGGLGADTLTGGGGADSFRFSTALGGGNIDAITDFVVGTDKIVLIGGATGIFTALSGGALPASAFQLGATATTADARILYDSATGILRYDADGNGSGAAVQFATLGTGLALTASSFSVTASTNHAPVITSGGTATVAENSPNTTIVYQTAATDADGDALSYRLTGTDAGLLTVDSTGAVRLVNPADYETKNSYSFNVGVKDALGVETLKAVVLSITDVNEPLGPTPSINETASANDSIAQAQLINRATLAPSTNANLPDDSLPSIVIHGNVATATDQDYYAIVLHAGEQLILDVDNSSGNLDTYLTIYDSSGNDLGSNDDTGASDPGSDPHPVYGHNTDSTIRFRAPSDGTYYFAIESFQDPDNPTTGTYDLNVSIGPVATEAQIFEEDVQALLSGYQWNKTALTYAFPTSGSQYPAGTEETSTFAPFTTLQQGATTQILQLYSAISALTFTQNTNPALADLRYAMSDTPDTAYGYYPTGSSSDGQAWFSKTYYNDPTVGNYAWVSILHETGHLMGLKHGHEAPAVSPGHDTLEYTVMTYRAYQGADVEGGYTNEEFGFPQTLMMLDIAAIQQMYGANFSTNSGNTTYSWNPVTGAMSLNGTITNTPGANRVFLTVWDGGGTDTYDLSAYGTGVSIDLRPGEWTTTTQTQTAYLGDGHYAVGNIANALLFEGDTRSLIENAIGGAGNDSFTANQAANSFTGNGGTDTFYWRSASDGGTGTHADTITDFTAAQNDKISFADIDLNPSQAGHESLTFIGTTAFHHVAGEIRYDVTGGNAHVLVDIDGNGTADMEIILNNVASVSQSMFTL